MPSFRQLFGPGLSAWYLGLACLLPWVSAGAEEAAIPLPQAELNGAYANARQIQDFLAWLQARYSEEGLPGAAIAIVTRESVLELQTWGELRSGGGEHIQADSLFRIASVSKTFGGTVASLVVAEQHSDWNTPLSDLLPDLRIGNGDDSRAITLRHVVSHTTGLMPHAYSNMLDSGVDYLKIQEKFPEIPTVCPPGRCYGYQNVVFSLISDVVELATQSSYEDYLAEQLFRPLGMSTATTGQVLFESSGNSTSPHRFVRGVWLETTLNPAYYSVAPAAGVNASIADMAIWARANLGGFPEVLSPEFLVLQHEPVVETPRGNYFNRWQGLERAYYALGWRVLDYRGLRVIHHGGGLRGFRSELALIPELDLGLVVLFNAETSLANDIVPAFLDGLIDQI